MKYFILLLLFSTKKIYAKRSFRCASVLTKTIYEKQILKIPYIPPKMRIVGFENKDL